MVNLHLNSCNNNNNNESKSSKGSGGPSGSGSSGTSKAKRRATFGGSRLSLHSLLFSHARNDKDNNNDQKISRSTNDLQQAQNVNPPKARSTRDGSGSGSSSEHGGVGENVSQAGVSVSGSQSPRLSVITRECPLCFVRQPMHCFTKISCCIHQSCNACMITYLQSEIRESRVMISCPECNEKLHPTDVHRILVDSPHLREKYEEFMLRRTLMFDPDTRWCPAPDCNYAVIAHNCAGCPQLHCERPGCGAHFCYHCKMTWHPMQTCDEARAQRGSFLITPAPYDNAIRPGDIKACPRCRTYIVKMNDGSCNHMVCGLCSAEFCWLCLKEISDLHYLSPSGCTFWGKKPWSRKKKLLWQLGTLIGAPVGITLIAGFAIPAIIFGVPIVIGRRVHKRLPSRIGKHKRRTLVVLSVLGSFIFSPVMATMAVAIGVPILLAYVYGVVPVSLCRNGGCGVTASASGLNLDEPEWLNGVASSDHNEKSKLLRVGSEQAHGDTSTVTGLSIGSGSAVTMPTISRYAAPITVQAELCTSAGGSTSGAAAGVATSHSRGRLNSMESANTNYEEASTKACAGSTAQAYYFADDKSVHTIISEYGNAMAQEGCSVRALAGSVVETKSCGGVSAGGDSASMRVLTGSIGPDNLSARHMMHPQVVDPAGREMSQTSAKLDELRTSPAPLLEETFDEHGAAIEPSVVTMMALGNRPVASKTTTTHRSSLSINSLQPPPNAQVGCGPNQPHHAHFREPSEHDELSTHSAGRISGGRRSMPWRSNSGASSSRMRAHSEVSYGDIEVIDDQPHCQHTQQPVKHKKILKTATSSSSGSGGKHPSKFASFRFHNQEDKPSTSRRHMSSVSTGIAEGDAEFMLMSPETFHQMHGAAGVCRQSAEQFEEHVRKAHSTSHLYGDASTSTVGRASELWQQLLSESGALANEPWLMFSRIKEPKQRRRTNTSTDVPPTKSSTADPTNASMRSTSYVSLPDALRPTNIEAAAEDADELESIVVESGAAASSTRRKSSSGPVHLPGIWSKIMRK